MGYSAEVRPKVFYDKKELGTKEGDRLASNWLKKHLCHRLPPTPKQMRKNVQKRVPKRNKA